MNPATIALLALAMSDKHEFIHPEGTTIKKTSILISAIPACALSAPTAFAQVKTAPAKPAMSLD